MQGVSTRRDWLARGLISVARQCFLNHLRVAVGRHGRAAEVALALLAHATGQMAGASLAVLGLAFGGKTKALLGAFVGLLLGHGLLFPWELSWKLRILAKESLRRKGQNAVELPGSGAPESDTFPAI